MPSSTSNLGTPHPHRNPHGGQLDAPTWKHSGNEDTSAFWDKSEAPLPPPKRRCFLVHPKQLSPFPERLKLPYLDEEILSGYEEHVSFIRDGFTTWVKADSNITLERHVVDVRKALAEYREASARWHDTPQKMFFDISVPNRSSVQTRLRIFFVDNLSAAKKHSRFCRCTSVTFTPRNVAKKRGW